MKLSPLFAISTLVACAPPPPEAPSETPVESRREQIGLDLGDSDDNMHAFLKTRGSLDPDEDVFFYWTGSIHLLQDADPSDPPSTRFPGAILGFEGFNVARFEPQDDGGVRMISRELAVYKSTSGAILDCWSNGVLGTEEPRLVPVVHVQNDPVNHSLYGADFDLVGDEVVWRTEIQLNYPSPLPVDEYPEYSGSNTYQGVELFNWYADLADLQDPALDSAPVSISWSRVGQLLPWMQAGATPGKLVYHTRGRKLPGGFADLPEDLRNHVSEHAPEFGASPAFDDSPNMTSWRVFKALVDDGTYSPDCS